MNTQPALRILLLYMLGVTLHRWVFHSIVMDEKAMQAGIGVMLMLMVMTAQVLITLYLLKDQMKEEKLKSTKYELLFKYKTEINKFNEILIELKEKQKKVEEKFLLLQLCYVS